MFLNMCKARKLKIYQKVSGFYLFIRDETGFGALCRQSSKRKTQTMDRFMWVDISKILKLFWSCDYRKLFCLTMLFQHNSMKVKLAENRLSTLTQLDVAFTNGHVIPSLLRAEGKQHYKCSLNRFIFIGSEQHKRWPSTLADNCNRHRKFALQNIRDENAPNTSFKDSG